MSSKISALSFTGTVNQTGDDLVLARAGNNFRFWIGSMFAGPGGVQLGVTSGGAFVGIDNADGGRIDVAAGKVIQFHQGGVLVFEINAAGNVSVPVQAGGTYTLTANGATITIDAAGNVNIAPAGGAVLTISYAAAVPGNWAGAAPTDLLVAMDRRAAFNPGA